MCGWHRSECSDGKVVNTFIKVWMVKRLSKTFDGLNINFALKDVFYSTRKFATIFS